MAARRVRGSGRVFKRGNRFWVAYYVRGETGAQEVREPAADTEREAYGVLADRVASLRDGTYIGLAARRRTVTELIAAHESYLRDERGITDLMRWRSHAVPLGEALGLLRVDQLTLARMQSYIMERRGLGREPTTIAREMQILRAALRTAWKRGELPRVPYVPVPTDNGPRQGFVEIETFDRLLERLPTGAYQHVAAFGYLTGWRRGEIVGLTWANIFRESQEIRLYESKNGHGRVVPMLLGIAAAIDARIAARRPDCPSVFHDDGVPIGDGFTRAWNAACRAAGVPDLLFHDLRRSAVRNLIRAGVSKVVAKTISGHRSDMVFDRYDITSTEDQADALARVAAYHEQRRAARTVVPFAAGDVA